jgi:hypothetical protein
MKHSCLTNTQEHENKGIAVQTCSDKLLVSRHLSPATRHLPLVTRHSSLVTFLQSSAVSRSLFFLNVYLTLGVSFASCNKSSSDNVENNVNREESKVIIYSAPDNEVLNTRYKVTVEGKETPVYNIKVAPASIVAREKAKKDIPGSTDIFETAGMTYFDLKRKTGAYEPVLINVSTDEIITKAAVFSCKDSIEYQIEGNTVSFSIDKPQNLTVTINDDYIRSLQIFVNEEETDIPDPNDPDVVYFGRGSYRFPSGEIEDGMTVYVAGGAVVRCYVGPHEWYKINPATGQKNYDKFYMFDLSGKNITLKGRGIIDQDGIPAHSRRGIRIQGENISVEGIILRNPSEWAIEVSNAQNVSVDNVKIIAHRAQTNGITVNASDLVTISGCFIKTLGFPLLETASTRVSTKENKLCPDGNSDYYEYSHLIK